MKGIEIVFFGKGFCFLAAFIFVASTPRATKYTWEPSSLAPITPCTFAFGPAVKSTR